MIRIIEAIILRDLNGVGEARHADIIISDTATHYALGVGGLPLIGDLQTILDAREVELWAVAQTKNDQQTTRQVRCLCYNSPSAGGWTNDEFQEAFNENFGGKITKLQGIKVRRDAIRAEWPLT